jgi:hypothetical protein
MPSAPTFRSYAAATTLAVALAPAISFGVSFDINRAVPTTPDVPTSGTIVTDSTGDSVLYPVYTTVGADATSFSLTNTSMVETVAAKVRFRDQVGSRDVLDFIVILSPNDKFDFYVQQNGGVPTAYWTDNSCVVGYPGSVYDETKSLPFPDPSVSGVPYAESAVGHLEVIGMLNLNGLESGNGSDLDDAANHSPAANGQYYPNNCGLLKEVFKDRAGVNGIQEEGGNTAPLSANPTALASADVGNVLNGSMVMTVTGQGVEAGTDAVMVRNTFERGFLAAQSPQTCTGDLATFNGVEQGSDECYSAYTWDSTEDSHPSLADVNWVGPNFLDPANPGTNTIAVLDELLAAQNGLTGDWSNNPANNVGFDWIVTFPTKYVYTDLTDTCPIGNVGNKITGLLDCGEAPFWKPTAVSTCDGVGGVSTEPYLNIYGIDEETTTTESPGTNPVACLSKEVQMLTIVETGQGGNASLIQTAADRITIQYDSSLDDSVRGWAALPFAWTPNATVPTHTGNTLGGAAVAPLLWTVRATSDPLINNGSLRGLNRSND